MSARVVYLTKSGVRVHITDRQRALRRGKLEWRGCGWRVDTGGRHGWLWLRNLTREVKP